MVDWKPIRRAAIAGAIAGVVGGLVAGTIVGIIRGEASFVAAIALGNLISGAISAGMRDIFRQKNWF